MRTLLLVLLISAPCAAQDYTNSIGRVADAINRAGRDGDKKPGDFDDGQAQARYQAQVMAMNLQQLQNALVQAQIQNQKLVQTNTMLANKNRALAKRAQGSSEKIDGAELFKESIKDDPVQQAAKDSLWEKLLQVRKAGTKEALEEWLGIALKDGIQASVNAPSLSR